MEQLSATEAAARLREQPDTVLLDCRESEELELASIEGAVHIPMGEIPLRCDELDPERPVIVICHHGVRSASVAAWLIDNDFDAVANLKGGIDAWSRFVDATVPRY